MGISHPVRYIPWCLLLIFGPGLGPPAAAAEPLLPDQAAQQSLTPDVIETMLQQAERSTELDAEAKEKLAGIGQSALAELQRVTELTARAAELKRDVEEVLRRVETVRAQLERLKGKEATVPRFATLADVEQALSKNQLVLAKLKNSESAVEAELKARAKRRREIREILVAIPERLAEVKQQLEAPAAEQLPALAAARRYQLLARYMALEKEVPALEGELAKYDAEDAADLVRLERDLRTQEVALAQKEQTLLEAQVQERRAEAAQLAVRQARDEAIAAHPQLRSNVARNRALAEATHELTKLIDTADRELKQTKATYDQLHRQFEQTKAKVDSVGLTSSIGALLRKQRATLPDVRQWRVAVRKRRTTIDDAQYELFEYDDERQELADPGRIVNQIVAHVGALLGNDERDVLAAAAHEVLDRKREYLDSLIHNYNTYFDTLVELDIHQQQIIKLIENYEQYVNERVLWIRTGRVVLAELQFDPTDRWLISASCWREVVVWLWTDARQNAALYFVVLIVAGAVLVNGNRIRVELGEIGQTVQRAAFCQYAPTLRAALLTLVVAGLWPGLTGFVGWRLNIAASSAAFAKGVGQGLLYVCAAWIPLETVRQLCRPQGLADAHFGWPTSATKLLRSNLQWLIAVALPLTFVTSVVFASDPTHGRDAVERVCFIAEAVVLAVFVRRILHPREGVFYEYIAYHQGGWLDRLKYLWCWVGVGAPLILAGLAYWGYYFTAQSLSWRLYATICLLVSLIVLRALLLRLILIHRRKLSLQQARERATAAAQGNEEGTGLIRSNLATEVPQVDISAFSAQTQRLLSTGMLAVSLVGFWLIWVEVLPALGILDRWPVWTTATQAVQQTDSAAQNTSQPVGEQVEIITFANLAFALLIAVVTFVSARNVPGLLEMAVLQRLPLDASVRYAVTSLTSYAIVMLGIVIGCSTVGLRWSQIQWLATALTFGLAFGLQEMFGNFVAGLIILFERPVRVGDVITVADVTGVVSRIRIRATSIVNWDRKEFIVPNKEFITGRVLNWTLSDQVNRIVIHVGIAFGSDTELARELLLKVANDHPLILKDPPSQATFEGFGDNALNFVLRTFLATLENRLQVIHDLHSAIDKAFREMGIEIAFPQRDLHVRSLPPALAVAMARQGRRFDDGQKDAA